ncbi:hypothetical protein, partial [Myroides marinus]|uniref:hypothetical protein n=1 Tax=Myroides marinus TaxID=703342 RepID=UPI0025788C6C
PVQFAPELPVQFNPELPVQFRPEYPLTFKLSNLREEVMAKPVEQETVVKKLNKQVIELQKALEKANWIFRFDLCQ